MAAGIGLDRNLKAVASDLYRLAGVYTLRVLKGDKPNDLPVKPVTKMEMITTEDRQVARVNLKPLIGRADEVIE